MSCVTGKKVYPTMQLAEEALVDAHVRFEYRTGQGPVNVYRCDDCGLFHLTSKGMENERLIQARKDGSLQRLRQAHEWDRKIKR